MFWTFASHIQDQDPPNLSQSLFSFGNTLNFCVTAESPYTFLIPEALQICMIVMSMDSFRCTFWSAQKSCYSLGIEFCTQWFRDFRGIYARSLLGRGSASPLGFLDVPRKERRHTILSTRTHTHIVCMYTAYIWYYIVACRIPGLKGCNQLEQLELISHVRYETVSVRLAPY